MPNLEHLDFCRELYVVEKTVEVVVSIQGEPEFIRIEAFHDLQAGRYKTRSCMQAKVKLQAAHGNQGLIETDAWVDYDLPWTDGETADEVVEQALGFLRERCD
ncbi:hypothetical protein [Singulisphaera acidiphila]|uniref:Uncharacterized protein n=1 Tax=Singulisphaera acidiphila (strain ATCC BAA-1392 / DSM 18658 / VKM B-2454 / MOB10) TaxID=886293 RepID=L0DRP1_SINAD|nr:hypothetical protein [Singulisphaera acidiphila]AGA31683.1 hypothetical protein Sinac_7653 [Singulisphaera acidiphila DSM 18658]